MLNPSVADGKIDDPTLRRIIGFTALGLWRAKVNLYPYRSSSPRNLKIWVFEKNNLFWHNYRPEALKCNINCIISAAHDVLGDRGVGRLQS